MLRFFGIRLGRAALTLALVLVVVFAGTRISGSPFEFMFQDGLTPEQQAALDAEWGLDKPVWAQFFVYASNVAAGDFGRSIKQRRPVAELYLERVPNTLRLALATFAATVALGLPLGLVAALKRRAAVGRAAMGIAFLGYAVPHFIVAIGLILLFSFYLRWLPSTGSATAWHFLMPTLTLTAGSVASVARHLRSAMLDVLSQDFLRTARAKGVAERLVVIRHAMRNALIPVVTILGLQVTHLINGSLIVETVFAFHGIGELFIGSVRDRDYPVLQFGVIWYAAAVVMANLLVDLLYVVIDPRIRAEA
jgi:ABC-type dipeptide/oligopeptide/nickel transport system permease component